MALEAYKIAVVVPCRNRRLKTLRFLQVFFAQTYRNFQVILVDANSTDGTVASVRAEYPQVTILHASDDCYWTATTNIGVAYALQTDCDYVLTINDDCWIEPDYLNQLVTCSTKGHWPILASRIDYLGQPNRIWALGTTVKWGIRILNLLHHNAWANELNPELLRQPAWEIEACPGNGVLIDRAVFERIGLYNERWLPHYHGDSELIMRARQAGLRVGLTPRAIVYDDSPLPDVILSGPIAPRESLWSRFKFTFFSRKSNWYLPSHFYLVMRYCPWPQRLWMWFPPTIGAMLGWVAKFSLEVVKRLLDKDMQPKRLQPESLKTNQ